MTEGEVSEYLALLDGPQCGRPWSARPDRRTVVDGVCDLPAGHGGDCGHEPNRTEPWVGVARSLLAVLDVERGRMAAFCAIDPPLLPVPEPRTLADVVAWLRTRRARLPVGGSTAIMLDLLANAIESGAPWRESCDGTPAGFPGRP